jgi:hypothetical protein
MWDHNIEMHDFANQATGYRDDGNWMVEERIVQCSVGSNERGGLFAFLWFDTCRNVSALRAWNSE